MALKPEALYKLVIMYMLNKVEYPLTNKQITEFFLENKYTDYFTVQKVINEMEEDKFLSSNVMGNESYYYLTSAGRDGHKVFRNQISSAVIDDVDSYLMTNSYMLRNESGTTADYYPLPNGDYAVHCQIKEGEDTLIELNLNAPDKSSATRMCSNWKVSEKSEKIYGSIMEILNQ